jgi:amino acid transporter
MTRNLKVCFTYHYCYWCHYVVVVVIIIIIIVVVIIILIYHKNHQYLDWVMEVQIGDPSAVKPVEWNEEEPEKLQVLSVAFIIFMRFFFTYATYLADLHSSCRD